MYRYVLAVCKISIGMYRSELVCIGQYHSVFLYISPLVPCNCHICQVPGQWRPAAPLDSMVYSAFNTGAVYRLQHWRSQHLQHWRRGLQRLQHWLSQVYSAFNTGAVYELAQVHAGDGVSPVPIFISSDATMVSKKMGGHPIIRECAVLSLSLDIGLY